MSLSANYNIYVCSGLFWLKTLQTKRKKREKILFNSKSFNIRQVLIPLFNKCIHQIFNYYLLLPRTKHNIKIIRNYLIHLWGTQQYHRIDLLRNQNNCYTKICKIYRECWARSDSNHHLTLRLWNIIKKQFQKLI